MLKKTSESLAAKTSSVFPGSMSLAMWKDAVFARIFGGATAAALPPSTRGSTRASAAAMRRKPRSTGWRSRAAPKRKLEHDSRKKDALRDFLYGHCKHVNEIP